MKAAKLGVVAIVIVVLIIVLAAAALYLTSNHNSVTTSKQTTSQTTSLATTPTTVAPTTNTSCPCLTKAQFESFINYSTTLVNYTYNYSSGMPPNATAVNFTLSTSKYLDSEQFANYSGSAANGRKGGAIETVFQSSNPQAAYNFQKNYTIFAPPKINGTINGFTYSYNITETYEDGAYFNILNLIGYKGTYFVEFSFASFNNEKYIVPSVAAIANAISSTLG